MDDDQTILGLLHSLVKGQAELLEAFKTRHPPAGQEEIRQITERQEIREQRQIRQRQEIGEQRQIRERQEIGEQWQIRERQEIVEQRQIRERQEIGEQWQIRERQEIGEQWQIRERQEIGIALTSTPKRRPQRPPYGFLLTDEEEEEMRASIADLDNEDRILLDSISSCP